MSRMDLISPRPRKDGKTFWQKVGAAFPRDRGGYSLVFDALPLPDAEGRVTVLMVEPQQDRQPAQQQSQGGGGWQNNGDEIPFSPEMRV